MTHARNCIPFQSAIAGWTVVRAGGSLMGTGRSGITHTTVPYPICRGLTR